MLSWINFNILAFLLCTRISSFLSDSHITVSVTGNNCNFYSFYPQYYLPRYSPRILMIFLFTSQRIHNYPHACNLHEFKIQSTSQSQLFQQALNRKFVSKCSAQELRTFWIVINPVTFNGSKAQACSSFLSLFQRSPGLYGCL